MADLAAAERVTDELEQAAIAASGRRFDVRHLPGFHAIAWFCLAVLYAPMFVLVVFSFNANRSVTIWTEFSLDWYVQAMHNQGIQNATVISLKVAAVATLVATIVATMAALATTRTRPYRGLAFTYGVINQPLMVPEIVTAVATLSFFALIKQATGLAGLGYLIVAHTVFCIPFAYMPIRARLEDMDLTFEQAAADLYATPWRTFRRVTLPLLLPGILAGAMLSFVISLDDVVISLLVAGPGESTLPIYMIGQLRRGVTPEMNAVSTVFLAVSVLLVTLFFVLARARR
jgi:spermidine/putrescine transport system permease protein